MTTTTPSDKQPTKPHWPRVGASFALFRDNAVLLVERAKPPRPGLWSLPGGHVEPGETAAAAAMRELREETGLVASSDGLVDVLDVIMRGEDGAVSTHYLLAVYFGRWQGGEPQAASDVRDARFVPIDEIGGLPLTPGAKRLIGQAWSRLQAMR